MEVSRDLVHRIEKDVESRQARKGRTHLGGSVIGKKCSREIWYGWRWVKIVRHKGRTLRLFKRGEREEPVVIDHLRSLGLIVDKVGHGTGNQQQFSDYDGHFGGSGDGEIHGMERLYPDVPLFQMGPGLLEIKTHGEKSFIDLAGKLEDYRKYITGSGPFTGKGVLSSKPEHYSQTQTYSYYFRLHWTLYAGVCKNTDDLYFEIIPAKPEIGEAKRDRAGGIINASHPPQRLSEDPSWWECRFCDFREICHYGAVPQKNCRSCVYAHVSGADWKCRLYNQVIPPDFIPEGCSKWEPVGD